MKSGVKYLRLVDRVSETRGGVAGAVREFLFGGEVRK